MWAWHPCIQAQLPLGWTMRVDVCYMMTRNKSCEDLKSGFIVDCTGAGYLDVDLEEDERVAEPHTDNATNPKKITKPACTQSKQANSASSCGSPIPGGKGLHMFWTHFSPS